MHSQTCESFEAKQLIETVATQPNSLQMETLNKEDLMNKMKKILN